MNNLKELRDNMKKSNITIYPFDLKYNTNNFVILFERCDKKPKYALAKLIFGKNGNFRNNNELELWVNSYGFIDNNNQDINLHNEPYASYFNIKDGKTNIKLLDNIEKQMPITVDINNLSLRLKYAVTDYVSKCDSEDPNKKYCFEVARCRTKRNGSIGHRSQYNSAKTQYLRSNLYKLLGNDKTIRFCYSTNPDDEKSDVEIIKQFEKNK